MRQCNSFLETANGGALPRMRLIIGHATGCSKRAATRLAVGHAKSERTIQNFFPAPCSLLPAPRPSN
ncbi:MAG: hypothetical protein F6K37_07780 [Moorea sp. SIO4E2]|uniref:hypothetical protein n=1 Tax=Moorena sp. SIO4E2 TaxID=2607826 RepID=UPI0013B68460|nr:hypothetical protein [Moorena sp. SIO4E2]NEQ05847.1 hypothetical protein [Moorena sp. SIO4E2]